MEAGRSFADPRPSPLGRRRRLCTGRGTGDPGKQRICRKNSVLRSGGIGALITTVTPTGGANLHLSKGVHPKVVQELLGHATITITLDTYSHVLPGMGDAAASAMNDALD